MIELYGPFTSEYTGFYNPSYVEAARSNSMIEKSSDPRYAQIQVADLKATIRDLENRGDQGSAAHLRDELLRCSYEPAVK